MEPAPASCRDQAERRPGHLDGHDAREVAARLKDGLSFLDMIARQVLRLRERQRGVPLVLMNSFRTRADSLAALAAATRNSPAAFRPTSSSTGAAHRGRGPHAGDWRWHPGWSGARRATATSTPRSPPRGMLEPCSARGYASFVSNADNLGAVLDLASLAWFARGGALRDGGGADARRPQGRPPRPPRRARGAARDGAGARRRTSKPSSDVDRWRYYNSNNLWVDLQALHDLHAAAASAPGCR